MWKRAEFIALLKLIWCREIKSHDNRTNSFEEFANGLGIGLGYIWQELVGVLNVDYQLLKGTIMQLWKL